ncbi:MAG: hypothetical protein JKY00_07035 [Roseicyclus sp.]|nr:hypothetical protein [Roseicyclus sp.]
MRWVVLLGAFGLSACVGGADNVATEPTPPGFAFDAEGIQITGSALRIDFGRAQNGVVETVTRLHGEDPVHFYTPSQCSAAGRTAVTWNGAFTLIFSDGGFSGWAAHDRFTVDGSGYTFRGESCDTEAGAIAPVAD